MNIAHDIQYYIAIRSIFKLRQDYNINAIYKKYNILKFVDLVKAEFS